MITRLICYFSISSFIISALPDVAGAQDRGPTAPRSGYVEGKIDNTRVFLSRIWFLTLASGTMKPGLRQRDVVEKILWGSRKHERSNVKGSPYPARQVCSLLKQYSGFRKGDRWAGHRQGEKQRAEFYQKMLKENSDMFFPAEAAASCNVIPVEDSCQGLLPDVVLEEGMQADCVSNTHAYKVEPSKNWAKGLGRALEYHEPSGLMPGVILTCEQPIGACEQNRKRLEEAVAAWKLPVDVQISPKGLVLATSN